MLHQKENYHNIHRGVETSLFDNTCQHNSSPGQLFSRWTILQVLAIVDFSKRDYVFHNYAQTKFYRIGVVTMSLQLTLL